MFPTWYGLWNFKDLNRRAAAHKVLHDKSFNIAKYPEYDGYQRERASMIYKFFDKKTYGDTIKNENIFNKNYKPIIRTFNKRKAQPPFLGNIWGADLGYMQLISKFNKGFRFLLCVVDIYSKYTKDKKRNCNY